MHKTAVITGASSGIGLEMAYILAEEGYHLILINAHSDKLNAIKADIQSRFGVQVDTLRIDMGLPGAADSIYNFCKSFDIDVLVNNAGFGVKGQFTQTSWQEEEEMLGVHIYTLTKLCKLIGSKMQQNRKGRILNVSSVAAFQPGPLMAVYYATKSYILSFSQALAVELQHSGVTVTVLCPGPTRTGFQQRVGSESSLLARRKLLSSAKEVARYGYHAMLHGDKVAIPGITNKLLVLIGKLIPHSVTCRLLYWLQQKNQPQLIVQGKLIYKH